MSGESVEVQLARVDERLTMILEETKASRDSRKIQYEFMEALRLEVRSISNRVESLEKAVATAQPTISEFVAIKQKVVGAGQAGKWLWAVGVILLGIMAGSRATIFHWLKGAT